MSQFTGGGEGHQHLGAVGEDTLEDAGEGVQQGGGLSGGDAVVLGHLLGDGVGHDDGDGVVGGGDVHGAHQQAHAQLTALLAVEDPPDAVQKGVKAAVGPDQRAEGGDQDGDHGGLIHPGGAGAHVGQQFCGGGGPCGQHDNSSGPNAQQQDEKDVGPENSPHENQKVGDHLNEAVRCQDQGPGGLPEGENQDEQEGDQRRRQGDGEVDPKFIPHGAALAVAGGDGGVRDKGEVVPKHGPAHDRGHTQGNGEAGGLCHRQGDGGDQGDGSHRRAHGQCHKAADHKENRHGELGGDQGEQKIGHAVGAAPPHHPHKNAGGEEDENHNDDVFVPHALPHEKELVIQGKGPVLEAGHQQGCQEGHHNGDVVEAHGDL